jgi:hypothetical protein
MKAYRKNGGKIPIILNLCTRWRKMVNLCLLHLLGREPEPGWALSQSGHPEAEKSLASTKIPPQTVHPIA